MHRKIISLFWCLKSPFRLWPINTQARDFYVSKYELCPLRCNKGRVGKQCECRKDEVSTEDLDKNCRKDNGTDICSNNGECVCGTCECKKRDNPEERYSGKFCECDNFNCDRSNNKLCGGTAFFSDHACHQYITWQTINRREAAWVAEEDGLKWADEGG